MTLIFCMSTDVASSERTKPVVRSLLLRIVPSAAQYLTPAQIGLIDYNLRKMAHVTEYAILAALAYRAIRQDDPRFRNRHVWLPLLIGVLYAASDEYHQSFSPSRGAKVEDVVIDSTGVIIGVFLCLWHRMATMERERKRAD
jgi:Predicted integral membrane protein